jgi:hypothetical protein
MLFHCNNGCMNAPQCYVTYIACLVAKHCCDLAGQNILTSVVHAFKLNHTGYCCKYIRKLCLYISQDCQKEITGYELVSLKCGTVRNCRTNAHSNPFALRVCLHCPVEVIKKIHKVLFEWYVLQYMSYMEEYQTAHRNCTEWVGCSGFVYSTRFFYLLHSNYARYEARAPRVLDYGIRCRTVSFTLRTVCL